MFVGPARLEPEGPADVASSYPGQPPACNPRLKYSPEWSATDAAESTTTPSPTRVHKVSATQNEAFRIRDWQDVLVRRPTVALHRHRHPRHCCDTSRT